MSQQSPETSDSPGSPKSPGWRDGAIGLGFGCLTLPALASVVATIGDAQSVAGWVGAGLIAAFGLAAVVAMTRYFARRGTAGRFWMGLIVGIVLPVLLVAGCFALVAGGRLFG